MNYLLMKYPNREWSGPAWYSHTKDENGFPTKVKLEYFIPLHLGTSSATDWDGKHLVKRYRELRKKFPKIGKSWVQGNIHSHHGMGAFFSGTDQEQLIDGANENFYYSLVVSTKVGKEYAMAVSYPDQFGRIHLEEMKTVTKNSIKAQPEWENEVKFIEEEYEKNKPTFIRPNGIMNRKRVTKESTDDPETIDWNQQFLPFMEDCNPDILNAKTDVQEKFEQIEQDFFNSKLPEHKYHEELKKLGYNRYGDLI